MRSLNSTKCLAFVVAAVYFVFIDTWMPNALHALFDADAQNLHYFTWWSEPMKRSDKCSIYCCNWATETDRNISGLQYQPH